MPWCWCQCPGEYCYKILCCTQTQRNWVMRGEGECPLYWRYPGQVIRSHHHGPMSGVWSPEDGDHSNNFIFGLKPNSVIPRGLSEWIESTHLRYLGDWGRYSNWNLETCQIQTPELHDVMRLVQTHSAESPLESPSPAAYLNIIQPIARWDVQMFTH